MLRVSGMTVVGSDITMGFFFETEGEAEGGSVRNISRQFLSEEVLGIS